MTFAWTGLGIMAAGTAANIGMKAGGVGGGGTTESVMGGVNGLLSGLMGSGLGGSEGGSMAPAMDLAQTPMPGSFMPPVEPTAYGGTGAPGTSPWSYQPASTGIMAGGPQPGQWQYQPAGIIGGAQPTMAPGMMGGGTAAGPYGQPPGVAPPAPPNPYMAAIGAAAPALSNVLAARIAQRPATSVSRQYGMPGAIAPVTVGGQPPPPRLSPLERYRVMLSGMR